MRKAEKRNGEITSQENRTFGYDRYSPLMPPHFTLEQHDDAWPEARDMEVKNPPASWEAFKI
jgi:hypothetical protein